MRWWLNKARQFTRHLTGRVSTRERSALGSWLTPAQLDLFDAMHPADRRHGLDVVEQLRRGGHARPELLLAGLFHDCGKGQRVGLWHRVGWSLGERYGQRMVGTLERLPGFRLAFDGIRSHTQRSAELAAAAGCPPLTVALIRRVDAVPGEAAQDPLLAALRLADAAS